MSRLKIDGMPITDAKKPLTIKVTPSDVVRAATKEPDNCAVAQACKRALEIEEVRVHLSRVFMRPKGQQKWLRFQTSDAVRSEIISFDRGGSFSPGTYILTPVQPSERLGAGKKVKNDRRSPEQLRGYGPAKKKRRKPHVVMNVRAHARTEMAMA